MQQRDRDARLAGLLYLLVVLIAPYRLIYLPAVLFANGHAATTMATRSRRQARRSSDKGHAAVPTQVTGQIGLPRT